jgi:hypothetical protein
MGMQLMFEWAYRLQNGIHFIGMQSSPYHVNMKLRIIYMYRLTVCRWHAYVFFGSVPLSRKANILHVCGATQFQKSPVYKQGAPFTNKGAAAIAPFTN